MKIFAIAALLVASTEAIRTGVEVQTKPSLTRTLPKSKEILKILEGASGV